MVEAEEPVVWDILEDVILRTSGDAEPRAYVAPFGYPGIRTDPD